AHDRPEDLLVAQTGAGDDGGGVEPAREADVRPPPAGTHLGAAVERLAEQRLDPGALLLGDHWTHLGLELLTRADAKPLGALDERLDEGVEDRLLDVDPLHPCTELPGACERSPRRTPAGTLEISAGDDD